MGFIKGPKQLLSSAIVNALDKFFIVDSSQIESKLLGDARIVLKNVALRPIEDSTVVKKNTTGESSTVLFVTGVVEEVIFSWRWTTDKKSKTWVEDVNLTIKGAKFQIELRHGPVAVDEKSEDVASLSSSLSSSLPDEKVIADATKAEAKREGGIGAYVQRHVEAMLDALTLRLEDFKIVVEVPNNEGGTTMVAFGGESAVIESHGREHQESNNGDQGVEFDNMSDLRQTLSVLGLYGSILGNVEEKEGKEMDIDDDSLGYGEAPTPLLEPFSCEADIVRSGKRFRDFNHGLRALFKSGPSGLVLHAGHVQSYALAQFSVMLLSAKDKDETDAAETSDSAKTTDKTKKAVAASPKAPQNFVVPPAQAFPSKRPSVFDFKLTTVAVVLDKQRVQVSNFALSYIANGSKLAFEAEQFSMGVGYGEIGDDGECSVLVKGIRGSKSPELKIQMDLVEQIETAGVRLLSPMKDTHLAFEGNTLTMKIQRLQCSILDSKESSQKIDSVQLDGPPSNEHPNAQAPFPIDLSIKELGLQKNNDPHSRVQLDGVKLLVNPAPEGTEVAAFIDMFRRNIKRKDSISLKVFNVVICAQWPIMGFKLIENFRFAAKKVDLSQVEWANVFDLEGDKDGYLALKEEESKNIDESGALVPQKRRESAFVAMMKNGSEAIKKNTTIAKSGATEAIKNKMEQGNEAMKNNSKSPKSKMVKSTAVMKNTNESMKKGSDNTIVKKKSNENAWRLPNAQVDALKIYMSVKISKVGSVSVKNVAFTAKPFKGNDKTTSKNLTDYYLADCLSHLPEIALKTELLGVNTLDIGTNTYGTVLGMTTPFGAIGSVTIMVGADAVKGAVAAGKKARCADEADGVKPMDFFRGIGYAASDASRKGALRLGKEEGEGLNIIDWVVGASMDTGKYLEDNKARLGGAGGAGAGMVVGFMIGGPVGGIVGGVIGGVATQKTIEKIDDKSKNN